MGNWDNWYTILHKDSFQHHLTGQDLCLHNVWCVTSGVGQECQSWGRSASLSRGHPAKPATPRAITEIVATVPLILLKHYLAQFTLFLSSGNGFGRSPTPLPRAQPSPQFLPTTFTHSTFQETIWIEKLLPFGIWSVSYSKLEIGALMKTNYQSTQPLPERRIV